MGYTCKDCEKQCMERSREYVCSSFTLSKLPEKRIKPVKRKSNKTTIPKTEACKSASENVREVSDK